ncbi:MAG TPA: hypothetical protein VFI14_00215, partial [Chryseosolibacter sp.]|nr:hypothetical protein [Chryseosolibacter sp.]
TIYSKNVSICQEKHPKKMYPPGNQREFPLLRDSDFFCLNHFLPKWSAKVGIRVSIRKSC